MKTFPSQYNYSEIAQKWQTYWQEHCTYKWDSTKLRKDNFVIDTPPPTVSGLLHMGHIFSYTQTDFIARYQRMKGKNVFYPMGFDDNGLPTERLVEKVRKIKARDLPREEFRKVCMEVVEESEKEFEALFNSISVSVDWSQKFQTVSKHSATISQMSFLDLHEKGHVYRSLEPTIWDPVDRTALAQTDLEDRELSSVMNEIKFLTEDDKEIRIATTRPELLPACVAILFNPGDKRHQNLKNKFAISPLFGVKVPIIEDTAVEIDKGTGLVMCCTFGDATDIDWWRKHKLPTRVIIDHGGRVKLKDKLNDPLFPFKSPAIEEFFEKLDNKKIKEAREIIIEILQKKGLLLSQTNVQHSVKCAERSKAPVEMLVSPQWFIKVLDKKNELVQKANECTWHPEFMKHRIENWINGLKWDWCISRQRYFGVPFPVWYSKKQGEEGKVIVATMEQLPVDPTIDLPHGYTKDEVIADTDIMDTWATSAVTPQINSHAISDKFALDIDRHHKLFPADMRPQSHEIIRTWTFGTITKAMMHENTIPWQNIMISGWVLAADKTKMSKSKGNIVTPMGLIKEKGADVVRYWASSSKLGNDVTYSEEMFKTGKKLTTKLWNAAKFVSLHLQEINLDSIDIKSAAKYSIDKWLLSRLHLAVKKATEELEKFEYCNAREAIEDFFWNDFCDNYLELVKVRIYDKDGKNRIGQKSATTTAAFALEVLLKLFAPFLPNITEELYDLIYDRNQSIHSIGNWPDYNVIPYNKADEERGKNIVCIIDLVRRFKTEQQISLRTPLAQLNVISKKTKDYFGDAAQDLQNVTNAEKLLFNEKIDNKLTKSFMIKDKEFKIEIYKSQ
jgi:valyl-tRNA synthetase